MGADAHQPVLLDAVVTGLRLRPEGCYVDATFGRGGHSQAILAGLSDAGRLLVFDKDPAAVKTAEGLGDERVVITRGSFTQIQDRVEGLGLAGQVDGILMDLGVSSPQLDDASRGFSFLRDGPLDMRMNPDVGISAADWLQSAAEVEIARVLWEYGEERFSRQIAKAIVARRDDASIVTTKQLADLIDGVIWKKERHKHPATRSFQAIRIHVNNELAELQLALQQCLEVLSVGGRLCVISFHSLEDRIVKRFIQKASRGDDYPSDIPVRNAQLNRRLKKIGKLIRPTDEECQDNKRARSARFRIAEKIA